VPSQTGELCKALVARAALVLLHRQMQLRVLLEVAVGGEGLSAHRAQVLADRPVGVHVVGEAVLLVETLRTDRAVECRLVEVPAPVDIEKGPRLKGFAAQIADVGPLAGVSAQVDGHLRGCGEALVALLAGVWEVPPMPSDVHRQVAGHLEALPAQRADEGLGAIVCGPVHLVLIAGLDELRAYIASERSEVLVQELGQLGVQQGDTAGILGIGEYLSFLGREVLTQFEQGLLQLLRGVGCVKSGVYLIQHLTQGLATIRIRPKVRMVHIPQSRVVAVDLHELQLILGVVKLYGAGIYELGLLSGLHHSDFLECKTNKCDILSNRCS